MSLLALSDLILLTEKSRTIAMYKQCLLVRSATTQVSFIPGKFAQLGALLRLKDEDGWVVREVYQPVDTVIDYRKSIRQHGKNTGDVLPRSR